MFGRIIITKAQAGLLRGLAQTLRFIADEILKLTDEIGW